MRRLPALRTIYFKVKFKGRPLTELKIKQTSHWEASAMFSWADTAHFFKKSLDEFLNATPRERNYMVAYAETRAKMNAFDAEVARANANKKGKKK